MDVYPLCWQGVPCGELTAEREAQHTRFSVCCPQPPQGLWCVWLVGERGELRLGIPEPCGERLALCRRFSHRMTAPLGRFLRGELRPVEQKSAWTSLTAGVFSDPFLCSRLQGVRGAMVRAVGEYRLLALPCSTHCPFPLPTLFCFASIRTVCGQECAVFAFDGAERPVFLDLEKFSKN